MDYKRIALAVGAGLLFVELFLVGYAIGRRKAPQIRTIRDTTINYITFRDTVKITEFLPVYRTIVDTEYIAVSDTLYLPVPREQIMYKDSSFTAWVSGVRPALDSVQVYPKTTYINTIVTETQTQIQKAPRLSVAVSAGYGAGKDGLTPFFGVGLSYSLFSFSRK